MTLISSFSFASGGSGTGTGGPDITDKWYIQAKVKDVNIKDLGVFTIEELAREKAILGVGPRGEMILDERLEVIDYQTIDGIIHQIDERSLIQMHRP